ncbi:MAG: carbamate kinase [Candidatus Acidiferrum sp.]
MGTTNRTMLIAIGGNSLIRAGERGTVAEEQGNARKTAHAIVALIRQGYHLVITHGNGPQVGAQLLRSERCGDQVPPQTLDVCGAASQGEIGYILTQAFEEELFRARLNVPVATVITQILVASDDPAMTHPTKPIGPFYSRVEALELGRQFGWTIVEDAARGYRRVVPCPRPVEIVELPAIRGLVSAGVLVIACGGGGIPVIRENGILRGIEAVVDKDPASALLASELSAEILVICTATDSVYLDYRKPTQQILRETRVSELQTHYDSGQFPPGSMGPKIEAAIQFLKRGGREVIICSYKNLIDAVSGSAGTHILPDHGTNDGGNRTGDRLGVLCR